MHLANMGYRVVLVARREAELGQGSDPSLALG
jgi:hypothetical protein